MRRQRNSNRNFAYNTYEMPPEDIMSLIPDDAGEYVRPEDFAEPAALSILQNRRDVLFAKSIMENTGGLAFMAARFSEAAPLGREYYEAIVALYARKKPPADDGKEVAWMDEYTFIIVLIVVLLLMVIVLFWLADMVVFYSHRLAKLQEENSRLRQMVEDGLILDNSGMAAFGQMFGTACLHGFRDGGMDGDV